MGRTGAEFPLHPLKVCLTLGTNQRGVIQKDISAVQPARKLTFPQRQYDFGIRGRLQGIRRFDRRAWTFIAALAALNKMLSHSSPIKKAA
ncbi:hypothetical protein Xhom_05001 [Xenorhabdus hominickii]|uniref:Uncharacterized protein n=1 Tax=Xenorhabdus hominickii TaxID=351679 RepID=A0A2G0PT51_XENHO|nr:hypothetical protein Xhom_05001 [Xenorhabdus hominickii]